MNYIALADGMQIKVIDGIIEIMPLDDRHKATQDIIDEV
jgi:hypothetical protein